VTPQSGVTRETGFVAVAVELAVDFQRLAELRSTLRERVAASPLCDAQGFTAELEAGYRRMFSYCTA